MKISRSIAIAGCVLQSCAFQVQQGARQRLLHRLRRGFLRRQRPRMSRLSTRKLFLGQERKKKWFDSKLADLRFSGWEVNRRRIKASATCWKTKRRRTVAGI